MIDGVDGFDCRLGPPAVIALAVAATAAVLTPAPGPARAAAVLVFALIGPGATVAALLRVPAGAAWVMVTLTGSIALLVVGTGTAALAGWWQPSVVLIAFAALSAAGGGLAWRRDHNLNTRQEDVSCMQ